MRTPTQTCCPGNPTHRLLLCCLDLQLSATVHVAGTGSHGELGVGSKSGRCGRASRPRLRWASWSTWWSCRGDGGDSRCGGEDDVSVGDVREDSLLGSLSARC